MASCLGGGHFGPGSQDYIPVAEFYADKSVFVTGGTGFMGKVSRFMFHTFLSLYCILT